MAKSVVIWRYGYFDSKQNGAADRGIGGDGVIFLLLLKEIRLQLSHKASQQVFNSIQFNIVYCHTTNTYTSIARK